MTDVIGDMLTYGFYGAIAGLVAYGLGCDVKYWLRHRRDNDPFTYDPPDPAVVNCEQHIDDAELLQLLAHAVATHDQVDELERLWRLS